MNLGEIAVYVEQHPSVCVAGAAISTLFVAYLVYRLFLGKKLKVSKGKTKKRPVEKKKQEPVDAIVPPKSVSENVAKKTCNLSGPAPKKSERLGTKSLTKSSPISSTVPRESESPEPVAVSELETVEDQWITVMSGKKESKPGTGSTIKSSTTAVPGLGNKVSKSSKGSSRHAAPVGVREPLQERPSAVKVVPLDADETEEEWREVRFTRKGGKFKKNE